MGEVREVTRPTTADARIVIATEVAPEVAPGASIAVNGVCLTTLPNDDGALTHDDDGAPGVSQGETLGKGAAAPTFSFDVMPQTLSLTNLGALRPGAKVNLERALKATDRFDGHVVQGHVDGVATLASREPGPRHDALRFELANQALRQYLAPQGSITVDGVSLTITGVDATGFSVALIPTTLARTTLGQLKVGDQVNIETDALAKYAAQLALSATRTAGNGSPITVPGSGDDQTIGGSRQFFGPSISKVAAAKLPTAWGDFEIQAFRDHLGLEHAALVAPRQSEAQPPLVRVHSECLTGDAFGSLRCDCGPQLHAAMAAVAQHGGAVIYLHGHEGRGIGLAAKVAAYALQDDGLDTVAANTALGLPVDAREYSAAAGILRRLGFTRINLLTNNPAKRDALIAAGIDVAALVPLEVGVTAENLQYLMTKRDAMGHTLALDEQNEVQLAVKTFEELFQELTEKAAQRPAGSGTVDELDRGVHFIGKKIVEEAAEVWMAAEYEGEQRTAEEISQLIYHLQVMMIACDITLDDVYGEL